MEVRLRGLLEEERRRVELRDRQIIHLKQALERQQREVEYLKTAGFREGVETVRREWKEKFEQLKQTNANLLMEIGHRDERIRELHDIALDNKSEKIVSRLMEQVSELSASVVRRDKMFDERSTTLYEHMSRLDEAERVSSELAAELSTVQRRVAVDRARNARQISDLTARNKELNDWILQLLGERMAVQESKGALQDTKSQLMSKVSILSKSLLDKESAVGSLTQTLQEKEAVLGSLGKSLEEKELVMGALTETLQEKEDVMTSLSKSLGDKEGAMATLSCSLEEKEEVMSRLHRCLEEKERVMADLNRALEEKDDALTSLNQSLAEREGVLDTLNHSLKRKEDELARMNESLKEKEAVAAQLNESLREKDTAATALNATLDEKEVIVSTLHTSLEEKEKAVSSLFQTLEERENAVSHLSRSLEETEGTVTTLRTALQLEMDKLSEELRKRKRAEIKCNFLLETTVSHSYDKLLAQKAYAAWRALVEEKLRMRYIDAEGRNLSYECRVAALELDKEALENERTVLKLEKAQLEEAKRVLESDLAALQLRFTETENALRGEIKDLDDERTQAAEMLRMALRELEKCDGLLRVSDANVPLRDMASNIQEEGGEEEEEEKTWSAREERLLEMAQRLREGLDGTRRGLEAEQRELAATREHFAVAREEVAVTRGRLAITEEQLANVQEKLMATQEQLTNAHKELAAMHEELIATHKAVVDTQEELTISEQRYDSSQQDLERSQTQLASVETQLAQANEQIAYAQDQLSETQEQLQTIQEDLATTREELFIAREQLYAVKDELTENKNQLTAANEEISKVQEELSASQENLLMAQGQLEAIESDLATTQGELSFTQSQLETLRGELTDAKERLCLTQDALSLKKNELSEATADLRAAHEELARTLGTLNVSQEELMAANRRIVAANLEIEEATREIQEKAQKIEELESGRRLPHPAGMNESREGPLPLRLSAAGASVSGARSRSRTVSPMTMGDDVNNSAFHRLVEVQDGTEVEEVIESLTRAHRDEVAKLKQRSVVAERQAGEIARQVLHAESLSREAGDLLTHFLTHIKGYLSKSTSAALDALKAKTDELASEQQSRWQELLAAGRPLTPAPFAKASGRDADIRAAFWYRWQLKAQVSRIAKIRSSANEAIQKMSAKQVQLRDIATHAMQQAKWLEDELNRGKDMKDAEAQTDITGDSEQQAALDRLYRLSEQVAETGKMMEMAQRQMATLKGQLKESVEKGQELADQNALLSSMNLSLREEIKALSTVVCEAQQSGGSQQAEEVAVCDEPAGVEAALEIPEDGLGAVTALVAEVAAGDAEGPETDEGE